MPGVRMCKTPATVCVPIGTTNTGAIGRKSTAGVITMNRAMSPASSDARSFDISAAVDAVGELTMYRTHFGLREPPFGITPDTSFAFSCVAHQEALNTLLV